MPLDVQTWAAIVFFILLGLWIISNRKKIHLQKILFPLLYFAMYRTKVGLRFMDKVGRRFPRLMRAIGYVGIGVGFLGMIAISVALVQNMIQILTKPEAIPGVGLVLPFEVKGAFYVPFFYWIVSIFIIALVHEFSHGIMARTYGMKIKSAGFAVLGILIPILPAAFVEPDEKELRKRPKREQLSVFAAGPFSNIILAFVALLLFVFLAPPIVDSIVDFNGVTVTDFAEGDFPAKAAGLQEGEIVLEIDGTPITYVSNFTQALKAKKAGDPIRLKTDRGLYDIVLAEHPNDGGEAYLGVFVQQHRAVQKDVEEKFGGFLPAFGLWLVGLFYWLYLLNLGIGLFNLVPIGPIDGGRMLLAALEKYFPQEKAHRIWKGIGAFFLGLVLVNILAAFIL